MSDGDHLVARVRAHLEALYPGAALDGLLDRVLTAAGVDPGQVPPAGAERWDETTSVVISYADTVTEPGSRPLVTLRSVIDRELGGVPPVVHVLPFFPSSSDGGFSVIDHLAVDDHLGSWADVEALAEQVTVMADLVINHRSAASAEFEQFCRDVEPGRDWFRTASPDDDLGAVVRPRTHDLLRAVDTAGGLRHAWCTFSHDQIDLDFSNPEVLVATLEVLDRLMTAGVRWFRLDAVAYLWKEVGTPCIHLPQTHEVVRLLRTLVNHRDPAAVLITETNVPHEENLSYLGNGDEAHLIYNFSLPPLLLHTVLSGDPVPLQRWLATPTVSNGSTVLNFLASHDGIGLRPAEGLLTDEQIDALVDAARAAGGAHGSYATPLGDRPYEVNVSLHELLGPQRSLAAHTLMLGLAGIPGLYVHSLFGTPNDHEAVHASGVPRSINRSKLDRAELLRYLGQGGGAGRAHLEELLRRMSVRGDQPALHPDSPQRSVDLGSSVVAVERGPFRGQRILVLTNPADRPVGVTLPAGWGDGGVDVLGGGAVRGSEIRLSAYGSVWLSASTAS